MQINKQKQNKMEMYICIVISCYDVSGRTDVRINERKPKDKVECCTMFL